MGHLISNVGDARALTQVSLRLADVCAYICGEQIFETESVVLHDVILISGLCARCPRL